MTRTKTLPPTFFLGAVVLTLILHFTLPLAQLIQYPWRLLGFVSLVAGIVLNLVADQAFRRHKTTVKPFEKSTALVTGGIFGLTRNPMYLGMELILLGGAIALGSLTPFLAVVGMGVLFDRIFIIPEEIMLEEIFGQAFRDYCRRVRKWI